MRARLVAGVGVLLLAGGCGSRQAQVLPAAPPAVKVARCVMSFPDVRGARLARARLADDIARYLARRPGRIVYAVHDLVSGVTLGYGRHRDELITASGAKVDIVMALLARRAGRLDEDERDLAERMIRESDNRAADVMWARIGGSGAMSAFYRRIGLRRTTPGRGIYWGGTTSSPSDRIRLLKVLVKGGGGLSAADRDLVLGLMGRVQEDQAWGVSAAARRGDRVALKNGWTPRPFVHGTWAVSSYGRIAGPGRDLLLSVQTDLQPGDGAGIETVEGVARMIGTRWDGLTPTTRRPCPTNPLP
ncbi:serine hydrolase [Nonomuraea bangladeshensis]|uniref:Serine hydrolase n=1 Tax=Nonomuraea bangladeshensis TaxID=404385 RepID=A0ABV3H1I1_9ACTN